MTQRTDLAEPAEIIRAIFDAAIAAVEPGALVARSLELGLPAGPVHLVAFGKASLGMARGAYERLGDRIVSGVVVHPPGLAVAGLPGCLELCIADHPLPSTANLKAALRVKEEAQRAARAGGVLLVLISGGGSAHLTLPAPGLMLDDLRAVSAALMRAGAAIDELNTVRKHTEMLKGGGLARAAAPAVVHALILSDVIGDRLDSIASGPVSPDPTTFADALAILDRFGVREVSAAVTEHLAHGAAGGVPETPKPGDAAFERASAVIVGANRDAVRAAGATAASLGIECAGMEFDAKEEASTYGARVAVIARQMHGQRGQTTGPRCWIGGGETTVQVGAAKGVGGRCQEAALAAALGIAGLPGVTIGMLATDGVDGPPVPDRVTPAGGIVDGRTVEVIRRAGINPENALAEHDSTRALAAAGAVVTTGPTGTNVNDIAVALVYPDGQGG